MIKARLTIAFLTLLLMLLHITLTDHSIPEKKLLPPSKKIRGTAVVITGAASRIPQEAALLEQLYREGKLSNVCFISGASSGALNAVMLNAILSGQFTWGRYKKILFGLKNNNIYTIPSGKFPFNTRPLHDLLKRIMEDSLKYHKIGDLPINTSISATAFRVMPPLKKAVRFSNRLINEECDPDYNLINILMASTAIPFIFPEVSINEFLKGTNQTFIDGGAGEDHIPVEAVVQYSSKFNTEIERLYIVSRKFDTPDEINNQIDALGLKGNKFNKFILEFLFKHLKNSFIKELELFKLKNPELAAKTYIYVADFKDFFFLLDFEQMKKQYEITSAWAKKNKPVLLEDYIQQNKTTRN